MAKLTKEQSSKFNMLHEITMNWGEDSICTGLFAEFGGRLDALATCINGDSVEILEFNGSSWVLWNYIPINSKTKQALKRIVTHLIDGDFDAIPQHN